MTTESFVDSTVVLYSVSGDTPKAETSERLLTSGVTLSVQVLNECTLALRRKFKASWPDVELLSERLRNVCTVVPVTEAVHARGLTIARQHGLHVYDAMIVAAAVLAGCTTLWSEDMRDGLVIDGLTIRNPYR